MLKKKFAIINQFLENFSIPKHSIIFILCLVGVSAVLQILSAGLLLPFIDSLSNAGGGGESSNRFVQWAYILFADVDASERFVYILMLILFLITLVQIIMVLIHRAIAKFSMFTVQERVANALYQDILHTKMKFFYKQKSGTLINNITVDIEKANTCLFYMLRVICYSGFASAYIAVGIWVMPKYTFGLMGVLVGLFFVAKILMPYIYKLGQKNQKARMEANNVIVETFQGIRTVFLSCAQGEYANRFKNIIYRKYSAVFSSDWLSSAIAPLVNVMSLLLIVALLYFNRAQILANESDFFSEIVFFIYIAGNIFLNLGKINQMYSYFTFNLKSLQELLALHTQLQSYKDEATENQISIKSVKEGMEVKHIKFAYIDDVYIIHDISFKAQINQRIAFVGSSGSGKSTLVDLISGFHDDYTGSILIDGHELKNLSKHDWRNLLGYVSQETFIFNDTIRKNLTFGLGRDITEEEIISACRRAQVYEMISSLSEGLETELGERGVRLSGGEKQRLAIARLFLKDPPIILLDEATSSLDSESETKVKEALNELGKGRMVIAVAHRLSTIADYDQIYVLENGRIIEYGNHAELIEHDGRYNQFYTMQSME